MASRTANHPLNSWLKNTGRTKMQLARDLGVGRQAIFHWVRGDSIPRDETLAKLAKMMGLSANDLGYLMEKARGEDWREVSFPVVVPKQVMENPLLKEMNKVVTDPAGVYKKLAAFRNSLNRHLAGVRMDENTLRIFCLTMGLEEEDFLRRYREWLDSLPYGYEKTPIRLQQFLAKGRRG